MRINPSSTLLPEVRRGEPVKMTVNGKPVEAYAGETIASVLLSAGIFTFRHSQNTKSPRGLYCGMGLCYECLVTVNNVNAVRACVTPVEDGMRVDTCREIEL